MLIDMINNISRKKWESCLYLNSLGLFRIFCNKITLQQTTVDSGIEKIN